MTEDAPNIVYGRLLEAAHFTGYGFERVCSELDWLLESGRWRSVGPGYDDVREFLATVEMSGLSFEHRQGLAQKLVREFDLSQRDAAQSTGVSQPSVSRAISGDSRRLDSQESLDAQNAEDSSDRSDSWESLHDETVRFDPAGGEQDAHGPQESRTRRDVSRSAPELADAYEMRTGDARDVLADVPNSSVQLILTDPPYPDEADPLWEWLAEWSARVLIPGGSLIVFTAHRRLNKDVRIFDEHLRYWWLCTLAYTNAVRIPGRFVMACFKPVLWYVKEYRRGRTLVTDVLRAPRLDSDAPVWAQGEAGVTFLIEHLTEPGEQIVDPFAGTGEWGQIAVKMGRRWLGADVADENQRAKGVIIA